MKRAAVYARYSTDKQSKDSVEDQVRVCERLAEREGCKVVATFADPKISGGTFRRPQYQALLAAARRHEFEFILAEDLKRLWREQAEQWRAIKELLDLGVHVVTASGMDSRQKNYSMMAAVYGAAAELDRTESSYRTKRGLEGLAHKGLPTGGRAYGYEPIKLADGRKWRRIVPERAEIVRQIFRWYAAGWSPRRIAAELNEREIPSPGSDWRRDHRRRDGMWLASTINCSILDNPVYTGQVIWNRVQWVRSHADSSIRKQVPNPESDWIRHHIEELRIVPQELWERVAARRTQRRSETIALACRSKKTGKPFASRGGRRASYPLSGLLKCADCGSNFVVVDAYSYGCASRNGGGPAACENALRVKRALIEETVIGSLREDFLTPERIEKLRRAVARRVADRARDAVAEDAGRRQALASVEERLRNLVAAIEAGVVTPTTKERLLAAEAERAELMRAPAPVPPGDPALAIPGAVTAFKRKVRELPGALVKDSDRARVILGAWVQEIRLIRRGGALFAEVVTDPARLLDLQNCVGSGGVLPISSTICRGRTNPDQAATSDLGHGASGINSRSASPICERQQSRLWKLSRVQTSRKREAPFSARHVGR